MKKDSFRFYFKEKEISLNVKECRSFWSKLSGLMFKKKSMPLLFIFNSDKLLCIHSFFCKPFLAIWVNSKMEITQANKILPWRTNFCGKGRYLVEIIQSDENYLKMTKILNLPDGE